MSRIDALIEKLCPHGVKLHPLGELARIRNGKDYKHLDSGPFPVYGSGGVMTHVAEPFFDKPSVLIPRKGSLGNLFYVDSPFWTVDTIFYTEIGALLDPKFFYYFLKTVDLAGMNLAGGVPSLTQTTLNKIRIPLPNLEVQREIVSILDKFTQLEAELEAELEARRIQYEETRERLLDFRGDLTRHAFAHKLPNLTPSGIEHLELAKLGHLYSGLSGKTKADFLEGVSPFVSYLDIANNISLPSEIRSKVKVELHERQNEIRKGDLLFTGSSEDREGVGLTSEVEYSPYVRTFLNSFCFGFRPESGFFEPGYLKHLFRSRTVRNQVRACSNGVTRINISKSNLVKISIPIPPREVQRDIVAILDKLDALVNDIKIGLPTELEARRKQYEYYRNKILTFKELETE